MPFNPSYFRMANIFSGGGSDTSPDDLPFSVDQSNDGGFFRNRVKRPLESYYQPQPQPNQPDDVARHVGGQQNESPEDIWMRRFKQMTDTSGPAQEDYRKFIDTQPTREDYAPSKMRRLAAALVGGAEGYKSPSKGVLAAEGIRDMPYEKAMSDFSTKAKGKQEAAQEERQSLTARRALMNDALTDRQRWGLIPSQVDKNEAGAGKDNATTKKIEAKTAEMPERLDIDKRKADAKVKVDNAMADLKSALATAEPDIIAAMKDRAKAAIMEAQAAGVNASANVTKAGAAVTAAEAQKSKAEKTGTQPVYEPYHTQGDLDGAKKAAVKAVITSNNKYSGFGEKDKNGNFTGGVKGYSPSMWSDQTADYNQFQRDVEKETQRQLGLNARKRKVGTSAPGTTVSPTTGGRKVVGSISDFIAGLPDQ